MPPDLIVDTPPQDFDAYTRVTAKIARSCALQVLQRNIEDWQIMETLRHRYQNWYWCDERLLDQQQVCHPALEF